MTSSFMKLLQGDEGTKSKAPSGTKSKAETLSNPDSTSANRVFWNLEYHPSMVIHVQELNNKRKDQPICRRGIPMKRRAFSVSDYELSSDLAKKKWYSCDDKPWDSQLGNRKGQEASLVLRI